MIHRAPIDNCGTNFPSASSDHSARFFWGRKFAGNRERGGAHRFDRVLDYFEETASLVGRRSEGLFPDDGVPPEEMSSESVVGQNPVELLSQLAEGLLRIPDYHVRRLGRA